MKTDLQRAENTLALARRQLAQETNPETRRAMYAQIDIFETRVARFRRRSLGL